MVTSIDALCVFLARKLHSIEYFRDEKVIAEHDKERGTRQKIDEPDTPYVYYSDIDDTGNIKMAIIFFRFARLG